MGQGHSQDGGLEVVPGAQGDPRTRCGQDKPFMREDALEWDCNRVFSTALESWNETAIVFCIIGPFGPYRYILKPFLQVLQQGAHKMTCPHINSKIFLCLLQHLQRANLQPRHKGRKTLPRIGKIRV
jgi:hypothetical protein